MAAVWRGEAWPQAALWQKRGQHTFLQLVSVCGQKTQTAKAARATTGEAAQLQGGTSGGQGGKEKAA